MPRKSLFFFALVLSYVTLNCATASQKSIVFLEMNPITDSLLTILRDTTTNCVEFQTATSKLTNFLVGDLMTPKVISVTPDTHLMMILDIMIKKHVRRLPVISNGEPVGMVYISDLFNHLLKRV